MSCFFARETRPAASWPRHCSTRSARAASTEHLLARLPHSRRPLALDIGKRGGDVLVAEDRYETGHVAAVSAWRVRRHQAVLDDPESHRARLLRGLARVLAWV